MLDSRVPVEVPLDDAHIHSPPFNTATSPVGQVGFSKRQA
jgi:hypothetical protein